MLRRLLPEPAELELEALYAGLTLPEPTAGRTAWVALCMVASVDGAATLEGSSGELGGRADLLALSRLRGSNDVSLVGAGTVRLERYGPLTGSARRREDRASRGLRPVPRLAIVTASGQLSPDLPVFARPEEPPLVLTCEAADQAALERLADRAEIHTVGHARVDADRAVDHLADLGLRRVLCEGGPQLNQALLATERVDEVFLTVAPLVVGGSAPRIITGAHELADRLVLVSAFEHEGDLLLRYRHPRHGTERGAQLPVPPSGPTQRSETSSRS